MGQKVYEKVGRGGLEGPFTIDNIYGDEESGKYWYKLKSEDGLTYRETLETDLQKKSA